ncbi:hypothetical protein HK097_008866, partial [Rhizophlyctis rosea]
MSAAAAARLQNKTILITGASAGIGRSTAIEFAKTAPNHNLKIIITARRIDALKKVDTLAEDISNETPGVKVLPVQFDVSDPQQVKDLVEKLPEEYRDINVLVNNAGLVRGLAQSPNINSADIHEMYNTNVHGLINLTQAILPTFLARSPASGSIAGREPYPGGSIYCSTKAAVRAYTDSLRRELISTRIRVIEIDPGQVETEFSVVRFYGDEEKARKVYEGVEPLGPEDIAEVVVFAATRRENTVVADVLVLPSHQGG